MTIVRALISSVAAIAIVTTTGCAASNDPLSSDEAGASQSILQVAYPTQPDTLYPYKTTSTATRDAAKQVYESLVTLNADLQVTPQLAKNFEVSEDGKTTTFNLREGVPFHNGDIMAAEDVVASMKHWTKTADMPSAGLDNPTWEKTGELEVELHVATPTSNLMYILADQSQAAAIMPVEALEAAINGEDEYIGTGPFKLVEWNRDQHIEFERFEDYVPLETPASGLAGKKEALVDTVMWNFVTDASTQTAGLLSGKYDVAYRIPYDNVAQVESSPGMELSTSPFGFEMLVFNKKQGPFTDIKARQAVNYAIDKAAVMESSHVDEKYYDMTPALFLPQQKNWYTEAGEDVYSDFDVNKAASLLADSDYDGEEIHILTSKENMAHYNAAVVVQQQLETLGMKTKLDVYDWATFLERRADPEVWDIFFTAWDTMIVPQQYSFLDSKAEWPGWTHNEKIDGLLTQIESSHDEAENKESYRKIQEEVWRSLPIVNIGTYDIISATDESVDGYETFIGPVLWNVSLDGPNQS